MKHLDVTYATPAENLAGDEALLLACEASTQGEALRFWESPVYFVVTGYGERGQPEVHEAACQASGLPILRRCSGGGTVVQGPGCLNYALALRLENHPPCQTITGANQYIMRRNQAALAAVLGQPVAVQGTTDLTLEGRKFSGNAQRRLRQSLLFHGTLLLDFDLELIERLLTMPRRQPAYRENRSHLDFLTNLRQPAERIKAALRLAWLADA